MTTRRKKASKKSAMKQSPANIPAAMQQGFEARPEVQLIMEAIKLAQQLAAVQIPVDFDTIPTTTTATASISQHPFAAA
jgi:hypothetical protein